MKDHLERRASTGPPVRKDAAGQFIQALDSAILDMNSRREFSDEESAWFKEGESLQQGIDSELLVDEGKPPPRNRLLLILASIASGAALGVVLFLL